MKIKRFIGGGLESNGYIIFQKKEGSCFLIDPGYNAHLFIEYIKENQLKLEAIILTHHHYDHVGAVKKVKSYFGCLVYMHIDDCDKYKEQVELCLNDGDKLDLDGETLTIIGTPGHTKGGICIYSEKSKLAFTGDTIFDVDIGRTDFEDGSEQSMINTIKDKIDKWGNDIVIYPGHGDKATMKKKKKNNQEFLDVINGKFD